MHPVSLIVTHEAPDLDALLAVWLLKRFGEGHFPGIGKSKIQFVSAGFPLPGSPKECLDSGILAVDIQGGYFDHHSSTDRSKPRRCSALLVAEAVGADKMPELESLLKFVNMYDLTGKGIDTRDPVVQLISILDQIRGWNILYEGQWEKTQQAAERSFDAMYAVQHDWVQALTDAENAVCYAGLRFKVLGIRSDTTTAMRAGRHKGGDFIVSQSSKGMVSITATRSERLPDPDLRPIAALIRLAECYVRMEEWDRKRLFNVGSVNGWFLHESGQLLMRGSQKASDFLPTTLSLHELTALVALGLHISKVSWPDRLLPIQSEWTKLVDTQRGE